MYVLIQACFALVPQALEERGNDKTSAYTRMGNEYNAHVRTYHSDVYTPCTKTKTVHTTKTEVVDPKSKFTTTITTTMTVTAETASTSIVASSSGFIPIRSSLPDPGPPDAAVGAQLKRSRDIGLAPRDVNLMKKANYPQRVDVYHYKEKKQCSTKTKTITQTKKACKTPVKSTFTSTATSKVQSTRPPPRSTLLAKQITCSPPTVAQSSIKLVLQTRDTQPTDHLEAWRLSLPMLRTPQPAVSQPSL